MSSSPKTLRILAWVPEEEDTSPGQRYRIEQWAPRLRAEFAIEVDFAPFADARLAGLLKARGHLAKKAGGLLQGLGKRILAARRAGAYDLVYLYREAAHIGPALAERVLAASRVPFVFDFDDAIWIRYVSPASSYFSYLRFPAKTATLCRLAAHCMAGNPYLRDYALRYNSKVSVVPSTIDTAVYRLLPPRDPEMPVIGWTGSYSTVQYLALVRPALERLRRRYRFRVVVIGPTGFRAEGVEVEHRPWSSATEAQDLSDLDIGLMPLPTGEWERGKCGMKALQYMGLGIPVVVSPVGYNTEIVEHGRNGLLAGDDAAWEATLEQLLLDPGLRARLGRAGRLTVEERYSAAVQVPRVAAIFRTVTA